MKMTLLLSVFLTGYAVTAYILPLWPFVPDPQPAPGGCIAYQIAVDSTASNGDRSNWTPQADNFAVHLKPCDKTSFQVVGGRTGTGSEWHDPIVMPLVDSNAPVLERHRQTAKLEEARESVRTVLHEMVQQGAKPGDEKTDLLSLFKERPPHAWPIAADGPAAIPSGADNQWVIFSDGQESLASGVNLEGPRAGGQCINDSTRGNLVDTALGILRRNRQFDGFSKVLWIVPDGAGQTGCNSRFEVKTFWEPVIRSISGDSEKPVVEFQTNPFTKE